MSQVSRGFWWGGSKDRKKDKATCTWDPSRGWNPSQGPLWRHKCSLSVIPAVLLMCHTTVYSMSHEQECSLSVAVTEARCVQYVTPQMQGHWDVYVGCHGLIYMSLRRASSSEWKYNGACVTYNCWFLTGGLFLQVQVFPVRPIKYLRTAKQCVLLNKNPHFHSSWHFLQNKKHPNPILRHGVSHWYRDWGISYVICTDSFQQPY